MTTPPPLRQRHLEPGRGRVWSVWHDSWWMADYRAPDGTLYGSWAHTPADAHDWIRSKAKEATK